jgi:hypothetical protein
MNQEVDQESLTKLIADLEALILRLLPLLQEDVRKASPPTYP